MDDVYNHIVEDGEHVYVDISEATSPNLRIDMWQVIDPILGNRGTSALEAIADTIVTTIEEEL